MINGLSYMVIRSFNDRDFETLPHIVLTADIPWDLIVTDHLNAEEDNWDNQIPEDFEGYDY